MIYFIVAGHCAYQPLSHQIISILDIIKPPTLDEFKEIYCTSNATELDGLTYWMILGNSHSRAHADGSAPCHQDSTPHRRPLPGKSPFTHKIPTQVRAILIVDLVFRIPNLARSQVHPQRRHRPP